MPRFVDRKPNNSKNIPEALSNRKSVVLRHVHQKGGKQDHEIAVYEIIPQFRTYSVITQ
jgi:hypothetical protein